MAAMQLGRQRKQRREMERRMAACRKRAMALAPRVHALLDAAEGDEREQLEKDAAFLQQLSAQNSS